MEKYINTWKNSRENVLQQESHFLVDKEVWGPEDLPIRLFTIIFLQRLSLWQKGIACRK